MLDGGQHDAAMLQARIDAVLRDVIGVAAKPLAR